jgi:hypothetical protein
MPGVTQARGPRRPPPNNPTAPLTLLCPICETERAAAVDGLIAWHRVLRDGETILCPGMGCVGREVGSAGH